MTDSMISRCHCHITAILPQKRKKGPAIQVGCDDGLPPPPISGHRATGPSARARSPLEDTREGRLQFRRPRPLPQRGRWHLCEDTSHDCCCCSTIPVSVCDAWWHTAVAIWAARRVEATPEAMCGHRTPRLRHCALERG